MARKLKPETRAKRLVEDVSEKQYDQAYQLAVNLVFMEDKLDETRESIKESPLSIAYDNGGGQSGTRVNPEYQAYEALLKQYGATLRQFQEMTGKKPEEKGSKLASLRSKSSFALGGE